MRTLPSRLLLELESLLRRYAWMGVDADLASITAAEALTLFLWLSNLSK